MLTTESQHCRFNLGLEILLFDRMAYTYHDEGGYNRFNLGLEILLFDRAIWRALR